MNIKDLESDENTENKHPFVDETLEEKDKMINCSENKIPAKKQLIFRHQRNPVPNLIPSPSLNVLFKF